MIEYVKNLFKSNIYSNPYDKDKSFKKECGQTNSLGKYMSEKKSKRKKL